ncbi:hypothetical protein AAC387_Pa03g2281 [Persea americana]
MDFSHNFPFSYPPNAHNDASLIASNVGLLAPTYDLLTQNTWTPNPSIALPGRPLVGTAHSGTGAAPEGSSHGSLHGTLPWNANLNEWLNLSDSLDNALLLGNSLLKDIVYGANLPPMWRNSNPPN